MGLDLKDPEVALPPQAEIRTLDAFEVDPAEPIAVSIRSITTSSRPAPTA